MFQSNNRNTTYIIILVVVVLIALANSSQNSLISTVISLPGVLIEITFHEFAHAFAADKLGDNTPRMQGRLNLNPLSHIDPYGIVLLIFAGFGWGKPVQINPRNFKNMTKGEIIVSLAGPLMNFLLSIIFSIIYCFAFMYVIENQSELNLYILSAIHSTIVINIGLGVFNLIPLPPLDGSKIFKNIMPLKIRIWLENNETIFYYLFIAIWITGISNYIITPIISFIYNIELSSIASLFGLIIK